MPRARKTESDPSDHRPPKAATSRRASKTTKTKTTRTSKSSKSSKSTAAPRPSKASTGAQAHNPHTVRPANANYPNRGPVTLTYRNPRARKPRKLTVWVHVDQVIHWIERGLWHHLSPIDPKADIEAIQVGSRFM